MQTIRVEKTVNRSLEDVFAILSNHAGYARYPVVQKARLVKPGATDSNGLGAIRHVQVNQAFFEEEIVDFQPPYRFGYRVKMVRLNAPLVPLSVQFPFEHLHGQIRLSQEQGKTRIEWESRFRIPVPGGRLVEPVLRRLGARAFETLLDQALPN